MKLANSIAIKSCFTFLLTSLIACQFTSAQQTLNLDFELPSLDTNRAWSWDLEHFAEVHTGLDSKATHNGNYSMRMSSKKADAVQALSHSIEPYELVGKTLKLQGWIKTESLDGTAFSALGFANSNGDDDFIMTDTPSTKYTSTTDWTLFSIELDIPQDVEYAYIIIQHEGAGTSWFDDFELYVDGEKRSTVEVSRAFTNKELNWLDVNSTPLHSVDPGSASNEDLQHFKTLAADAQIIALGEATHGTSEFFRLKNRVLEFAVNEMGVRVFALEDQMLIVKRANKYVQGGAGTARSSMYGLFTCWQNEEVRDLIQWVRNWNDAHPTDKVSFVGFDMQNIALPIDSLFNFTAQHLPEYDSLIRTTLHELKTNGNQHYYYPDSIKYAWFQSAASVHKTMQQQCSLLLENATNSNDSSTAQWGLQYATLVKQFAENVYRGHSSFYRDDAMATNIEWILKMHPPNTKLLVWAHDAHISLGQHEQTDLNYYFGISMGSHLRKRFGQSYKAFGIWTNSGHYRGQISYFDFTQVDCPLYDAPVGSLDNALHQITLKKNSIGVFLNLNKGLNQKWLCAPIPTRFANHVNHEYGYWTQYAIPYQFDGLFFIGHTSAANGY